jgi:hypothetical protein
MNGMEWIDGLMDGMDVFSGCIIVGSLFTLDEVCFF